MPKVSIIIPCYNQAQYLHEVLDSVLGLGYQIWECIIVNDGSLDNTEEVAKHFCEKDNRFKYIYKENGGVSAARNTGIKSSSGEFILPLDADDLIGPDFIDKALQRFNNFPDTKLVYCKAQLFGDRIGDWNLDAYNYETLLFENIIFCTAMYRKKDYSETTGYNENMIKGYEDWDFWLTFLSESDIVYTIPEVCFFYRIRDQSRQGSLTDEMLQDLTKTIYNNHKEKYDKYNADIIWMNQQLKRQQNTITYLETEIKRIQLSRAYRFGKLILKPFSILRSKYTLPDFR